MNNKFEERESFTLHNSGQKIFAVMHRPINKKKSPAVIMCHGLAGDKTGKFRVYVLLAEMLAKHGIISLRFDFRGSGDSEGDFSDMTIEGEVSDALTALAFLEQSPYVDTSKLGVFGRSIGGSVAILAASRFKKIKSIVTWAPLSDGEQWINQWKRLQSPNVTEEMKNTAMRINGQLPGDEFFKQLFSMKIKEELSSLQHVPMLHIHGENDEVVLIEHAKKYEKFRENVLEKTRFIRLPNADHDFSDMSEQSVAINETCQWFVNTLGNRPLT